MDAASHHIQRYITNGKSTAISENENVPYKTGTPRKKFPRQTDLFPAGRLPNRRSGQKGQCVRNELLEAGVVMGLV
jgi:hypothetical protein